MLMILTGILLNKSSIKLWKVDKLLNIPKKISALKVSYHYNTAFLIRKNDCETMVRSYVDDCGQFLDLANRENVRILAGKTLIWSIINQLFLKFHLFFEIKKHIYSFRIYEWIVFKNKVF